MTKILLVEDDEAIIEHLSGFLKSEGFACTHAKGQREAMDRLASGPVDLVLLDVCLQEGSGFVVCSAIKQKWNTPVIFLTASDDEYSVVTGLELGADDYIIKPFRPRELVSRIRTVLRRSGRGQQILSYGDIRVEPEKGTVSKNGRELFLSALEYRLLLLFLNHPGRCFTRAELLEDLWDAAGDYVNDNTLTVYIKRLREKIEDDPKAPSVIRTVRGLGYKVGE